MTYTDPRILPCFHTACLKCFEDLQSKNDKNPGDVLPCPLCRKEFSIPLKGMKGLQKNYFIESLMEVTKMANLERTSVPCNTCSMMDQSIDVTEATMRCLNCCENYCLRCSKIHKNQKLAKDHKIVEINSGFLEGEIRNMLPIRNCERHSDKMLDYYCSDCKIVVCVSCSIENHQKHQCTEAKTIDEKFRQELEKSSGKISDHKKQLLSKKMNVEEQKKKLLEKTLEIEDEIRSKSQELKSLIDQHTQVVLDELFLLKQKHQKKMETEIEEIERKLTVLESFVTYCTELKSKGSPSEVCGCAENLISRAKELSDENEEYMSSPIIPAIIEFVATDENTFLQNVSNVTGKLSETVKDLSSFVVVIGRNGGHSISNDVIKINLNRPDDVTNLQPIPTQMEVGTAAAVYCNSIFVTGAGGKKDEIWRFNAISSNWKKCASLVKGRRRHSVAFVDHVLYICGGYMDTYKVTFNDIEAYDTVYDVCTTVGKLVHAVHSTGNCVPLKALLYLFGGCGANFQAVGNVQVYDTKLNTCTLLSRPMPRAEVLLRAALWGDSVILLGYESCFVYHFDTETWEVRDQFKTGAYRFGLIVNKGDLFVIRGSKDIKGVDGDARCMLKDGVHYMPIINILKETPVKWSQHAKLPNLSFVFAFGKVDLFE